MSVDEQFVIPSLHESMMSSSDEYITPAVLPQKITRDDSSDGSVDDNEFTRIDVSDSGSFQDSGVEDDLILPDKETCDKIVAQVEQYFSDACIRKDAFLLKHVKKNKEGFVSLKLVSSFKRLKHITKDWRIVAHALKSSNKIQINDTGNKIRRVDPLPEFDEATPCCRTVVALNLPMEKPTIENVAELFGKCGEIALVRILRPGNSVPQDVRQYVNKHPQIGTSTCALVEFETAETAKMAEKTMTSNDWRKLQVLLLAVKNSKKQESQKKQETKDKKKKKGKKKNCVEKLINDDSASCSDTDDRSQNNVKSRLNQNPSLVRSIPNQSQTSACSIPNHSPTPSRSIPNQIPTPSRLTLNQSPTPARSLEANWRRNVSLAGPETSSSPPKSPWMQRRLEAEGSTSSRRGSLTLVNVVRQPRGPDDTKGFYPGSRGANVTTVTC